MKWQYEWKGPGPRGIRLGEARAGDVVLLHGVQLFSESNPSNALAYDFGYSRSKACTHRGPELVWRDNGHGDAQKPVGECECVVAAHHLWDCKRHARELNTAPKASRGGGGGDGSPTKRARRGASEADDIAAEGRESEAEAEAGEVSLETAVQRVLKCSFLATVAPVRIAHVRWKDREGGGGGVGGEDGSGGGKSSGAGGGDGGGSGNGPTIPNGRNGSREALIHFTSLMPPSGRGVGALELPPFVAHLDAAAVEALVQVEVRAHHERKRQRQPPQQGQGEGDGRPLEEPTRTTKTPVSVSDADVVGFERLLSAQARRDDATATAFQVRVWGQRSGVPFVDEETGCAAHFKLVPPYLEKYSPERGS